MARPQALMIQVATGDPRPIGRQIVDAVRMKIATGELAPGDQLPSVRGLAQQLTINPNTVAKAYAELTTEGWLEPRQGMGLYVSAPRQRLSDDERTWTPDFFSAAGFTSRQLADDIALRELGEGHDAYVLDDGIE